jgi:hypothetical protein
MIGMSACKRAYLRLMRVPIPQSCCAMPAIVRGGQIARNLTRRRSRVLVNINIDDVAPYFADDGRIDLGGKVNAGLALEFERLFRDFPTLRLTLFVVPNLQLSGPHSARHASFCIADPENAEWLAHYRRLSQQGFVELAIHGYRHRQTENRLFQQHVEFAFKDRSQAKAAIEGSLELFRQAGLPITGFRPPGWGVNSDLSILGVIRESPLAYIAGSSFDGGLNERFQLVSNYYPTLIGGVVNLPQNVLLDWPKSELLGQVERIFNAKGIISIKGHTRWFGTPNDLTVPTLRKLRWLLREIDDHFGDAVEYATLYDIAKLVDASLERPALIR